MPRLRADAAAAASARGSQLGVDRPRALAALLVGVALRAYVYFGLLSFVPLYEERVRGRSDGYGALLLSALLFAGALGTLVMGRLSDRRSPRRLMAGAMLAAAPLVALYVADPGPLGAAAAVLAGAVVISTFGLSLQLAQDFLPSSAAQAAGLSIGLSVGLGGVASLLIGLLADRFGLGASLASCAAVALLAGVVAARLPDGRPAAVRPAL